MDTPDTAVDIFDPDRWGLPLDAITGLLTGSTPCGPAFGPASKPPPGMAAPTPGSISGAS